jgi:hypothetical protein
MAEQGRSLPYHVQKDSINTSNVADWRMDFCAYNAEPTTMNGWLRSAVPTVGVLV